MFLLGWAGVEVRPFFIGIILMSITLIGDQIPSFPESFARRLQDFDKDLHVMWHKSPFSKKPETFSNVLKIEFASNVIDSFASIEIVVWSELTKST